MTLDRIVEYGESECHVQEMTTLVPSLSVFLLVFFNNLYVGQGLIILNLFVGQGLTI